MKFPRNIIYIGPKDGRDYIFTLQGFDYLVDDVTEDGEVYIGYIDEWFQIFISNADLDIIRTYKQLEEIAENNYILKQLTSTV
jgi:hypothetical protein